MGRGRQGSRQRTNEGKAGVESVWEWLGGPRQRWAWHPSCGVDVVLVSLPVVGVSASLRGKGRLTKMLANICPDSVSLGSYGRSKERAAC